MNLATSYNRFSPRRLDDGDSALAANNEDIASMSAQIETNLKYAMSHDLTIVNTLRDPFVSARKTPLFERPEGSKLQYLPRGHHIIALKLARMFRSAVDGLQTLAYFEERGITVHFSDEGGVSLCTGTAKGKLVATMLLGVAEYEPNEIAERTSHGMKQRQSKGQRMTSIKTIPYGQKLDPRDPSRTVPCEIEMAAAGQAVHLKKLGHSLREIARKLGPIRGKILSPSSVNLLMKAATK